MAEPDLATPAAQSSTDELRQRRSKAEAGQPKTPPVPGAEPTAASPSTADKPTASQLKRPAAQRPPAAKRPPAAVRPPSPPQNSLLYDILVAVLQVLLVLLVLAAAATYAVFTMPDNFCNQLWSNNTSPAPPGTLMGPSWFIHGGELGSREKLLVVSATLFKTLIDLCFYSQGIASTANHYARSRFG